MQQKRQNLHPKWFFLGKWGLLRLICYILCLPSSLFSVLVYDCVVYCDYAVR